MVRAHRLFGVVGPRVLIGRAEVGAHQRHRGDAELFLEVRDFPVQAKPPAGHKPQSSLGGHLAAWLSEAASVGFCRAFDKETLGSAGGRKALVASGWKRVDGSQSVVRSSRLPSASVDSRNPPVCVDLCFGF